MLPLKCFLYSTAYQFAVTLEASAKVAASLLITKYNILLTEYSKELGVKYPGVFRVEDSIVASKRGVN